jgi:hypothetical protein
MDVGKQMLWGGTNEVLKKCRGLQMKLIGLY